MDRTPRVFNVAYDDYNDEERWYFRAQSRETRRKIANLEDRVRKLNERNVPLRFRVLLSDIDERVKALAMRKVDYLSSCDASSSEYYKILHWVESLCALPIGKYKSLPVSAASGTPEISRFLTGMKDRLDSEVYGHREAKGHIVRLLARWVTNPDAKGLVVGIHGQMGTGKTSLCKAICSVLELPFAFVPLGGANDGCFLDGHSFTYEGSTWGRIAGLLMKCKCMNPVIFFDELDKISDSNRGKEVNNILVHLTDSSQNDKFNDKYFADVELDLSRCLVVFSYNEENKVDPILRDRMTCVHTDGYGLRDKLELAKRHLIPSVLTEFNMRSGSLEFSDEVIQHIIEVVEEEQGVRNLRRGILDIVGSLNLERYTPTSKSKSEPSTSKPSTSKPEDQQRCRKRIRFDEDGKESEVHQEPVRRSGGGRGREGGAAQKVSNITAVTREHVDKFVVSSRRDAACHGHRRPPAGMYS